MTSRLLLILALISCLAIFASAQIAADKYIGYTYKGVVPGKKLSNGVKLVSGSLIGDVFADPVYGISQAEKGKQRMLWLEVSTGKDEKGVSGWKVLDALSFPATAHRSHIFVIGAPDISCLRSGKEIPNLVAIGTVDRRKGRYSPSHLWTANLVSKRFERFSIRNVKCEYSEP